MHNVVTNNKLYVDIISNNIISSDISCWGKPMKKALKGKKHSERFDEEKKQLSEIVKLLIKLYYEVKNQKELTESAAATLKEFIFKVTGRSFKYANETLSMGHYTISATTAQLESFVQVMEILAEDKQSIHFVLTGIKDEIITSFNYFETEQEKYENDDKLNKKNESPEIEWLSIKNFNRLINESIDKQKSQWIHLKMGEIVAEPYRLYMVAPMSHFARSLLKVEPKEDPITAICAMKLINTSSNPDKSKALQHEQGWKSFIQIARAVLINFHITFGTYERIKKCRECGKLFFEKKKGSGLYCSLLCKKKYNDKLLGDKHQCMQKQNRQIDRLYTNKNIRSDKIKPHHLYKYQCTKCQINPKPKGGNCPILIKLNEALFNRLTKIEMKANRNNF